jgi:molybdopterin-binding protein
MSQSLVLPPTRAARRCRVAHTLIGYLSPFPWVLPPDGIDLCTIHASSSGAPRKWAGDDTIRVDFAEGNRMALVTVRTAADRLGVAYSTLKRWVHTGHVRTTRTEGGHHRVSDAEIDRLMTHQQPGDRRVPRAADPDESLGGLSARNRLEGFIDEVRIDGLLAQVRLRIGDRSITAVITADAVRALKLRRGDDALAIVKSTEVMIARPSASETRPKLSVRKRTPKRRRVASRRSGPSRRRR